MKLFALIGNYLYTRKTITIDNRKISELRDIVILEDGEYKRRLSQPHWREYGSDEPILTEITKVESFADPQIYPDGESSIIELSIKPGNFFPRIYRPFYHDQWRLTSVREYNIAQPLQGEPKFAEWIPYNKEIILLSINQLALLKGMLIDIFNNIFPTSTNLTSYGHTIKNLLVLSCIEVEAQLQGIMTANNIKPIGKYYTTADYVKLKDVLQLDKYSVRLNFYQDISNISPFNDWDASKPTASLRWYEGYNKIKHDGDSAFKFATLENVINAISAIVVLLNAQFGKNIPYWKEEIGPFFEIKNTCTWQLDQFILPPFKDQDWNINYFSL